MAHLQSDALGLREQYLWIKMSRSVLDNLLNQRVHQLLPSALALLMVDKVLSPTLDVCPQKVLAISFKFALFSERF